MMYGGEKGTYPALIGLITSIVMTIISVLPYFFDFDNLKLSFFAFCIVLILGVWFTLKTYKLYKNIEDQTARELMLASFAYLPLLQIVYILDKVFSN